MRVYVVRHGWAGRKGEGPADDSLRPLDSYGRAQAEALAGVLKDHPIRRLLSSPATRCVQTLAPLSRASGLAVERCESVGVEHGRHGLVRMVTHPSVDEAAICTHGEAMRPLLGWLAGVDAEIDFEVTQLHKGAAWILDLECDRRSHAWRARVAHVGSDPGGSRGDEQPLRAAG